MARPVSNRPLSQVGVRRRGQCDDPVRREASLPSNARPITLAVASRPWRSIVSQAAAGLRPLPTKWWPPGIRPHPAVELETSPPGGNPHSSPAVPPACHKQRSRAVCSGQSRSIGGGRWAGLRLPDLGWGRRPKLHGMQGVKADCGGARAGWHPPTVTCGTALDAPTHHSEDGHVGQLRRRP